MNLHGHLCPHDAVMVFVVGRDLLWLGSVWLRWHLLYRWTR